MSIYKNIICTFFLFLLAGNAISDVFGKKNPNLGKSLSDEEVKKYDFVIMPNGQGLPNGQGSVDAGKNLYDIHCMACHGKEGVKGLNGDLAGGHGTISGPLPKKTVGSYWPYSTILFDYIRRAMPYQNPGSLTNDEIYSISAYILFINNIIDSEMILNKNNLPGVKMPNSENFVWAFPEDSQF